MGDIMAIDFMCLGEMRPEQKWKQHSFAKETGTPEQENITFQNVYAHTEFLWQIQIRELYVLSGAEDFLTGETSKLQQNKLNISLQFLWFVDTAL